MKAAVFLCILSFNLVVYSFFLVTPSLEGPGKSWRLFTIDDGQGSVLEGIAALITRTGRPGPINVPRKRLELPFAVQLMRSSYNTADELDFVAMDEFQKDFFKYRSYEWEDYRAKHPNILQGDLTDPNYFDFITFAQYAVINEKMKNAKVEFVEKFNADGDTRVVRKEISNALLAPTHSSKVGNFLLDYIIDTYTPNGLVPKGIGEKKSTKKFVEDVNMIMDVFTINGYCLDSEVVHIMENGGGSSSGSSENDSDRKLLARLTLKLPANLWSFQVLKGMKAPLLNEFSLKVIGALAQRSDISVKMLTSSVKDTINLEHVLEITEGRSGSTF